MPTPTPSSNAAHAALSSAIVANRPRLLALAVRMLGDHHAAEDAVQEASLRALQSVDRFRGDASIGTWLYRITANVCLDELRRRRRVVIESSDDGAHDEMAVSDFSEDAAARADLAGALAALPTAQREALVLTDVRGLNYAEASAVLRVPAGTVASRLHRAKETMRVALAGSAAA